MANLPILVFSGKRPPGCTMAGCDDQANKWTSRPELTAVESVSDSLARNLYPNASLQLTL